MRVTAGLVVLLVILGSGQVSPAQEGAMGQTSEIPPIVGNEIPRNDNGWPSGGIGMTGASTCPGFILGRGTVLSVILPSGAVALRRAADFNGKDVELVLREIQPRPTPQEIRR